MKKMQIYEPAMCCSTGLCGVGVNPELLRISTVLNTIKKSGVSVDRYNLSSAPGEFVNNRTVNEYVSQSGVENLPVIVLDGRIIITGRYPSNEEFTKLLGLPAGLLGKAGAAVKPAEKPDGCGCKGGCC